jgi:hypothetical protein
VLQLFILSVPEKQSFGWRCLAGRIVRKYETHTKTILTIHRRGRGQVLEFEEFVLDIWW